MSKEQTRNSIQGMGQPPLPQQGVGARHRQPTQVAGGVEYQDIYTESEKPLLGKTARDPRIEELRKDGLSWKWVIIADAIGYDDFVVMWRLATSLFETPDGYMIRMHLPHSKKLERIQRNLLIKTLSEHSTPKEIPGIMEEYGMPISLPQVYRILGKE